MSPVRAIHVSLFLVLGFATLTAQTLPSFEQLAGPSASAVRAILAGTDGSLYAVLPSGFAWSGDHGKTWNDVEADGVLALARSMGELYMLRDSDVLRSSDLGASWEEFDSAPGPAEQSHLHATATGSLLLFQHVAGSGNPDHTSVWRWDGEDWVHASSLPGIAGYSVGGTEGVVLTLCDGRPWKSEDDGISWSQVDAGTAPTSLSHVAADGNGTLYLLGAEGMLRSDDDAQHWTSVLPRQGKDAYSSLAIDASGTVYVEVERYLLTAAHLMKSEDKGENWTDVQQTVKEASADFTLLGASGTTLFAGGLRNGLYRSEDEGQQWTPSLTGIPHAYVPWLAAHPIGGIFGLGPYHLHVSTDQGRSWTSRDLPWQTVTTFAADFCVTSTGAVLYRDGTGSKVSVDSGRSWQTQQTFGPMCPGPEGALFLGQPDGVYRSDDLLASIQKLRTGGAEKLYWKDGTLVAMRTNGGIHVSQDTGRTWLLHMAPIQSSRGEPVSFIITETGTMLADFSPNQDKLLNRSTDQGETWHTVGVAGTVLHLVQSMNGMLYALTEIVSFPHKYLGVLLSQDDGKTWRTWDNGLPIPGITSMAAAGLNPVYVGTVSRSVFANTGPLLSVETPSAPRSASLRIERLYPQPATQHVEIALGEIRGPTMTARIADVLGRIRMLRHHEANANGTLQFSLPLHTLEPGVYFLHCSDAASSVTRRLLIR